MNKNIFNDLFVLEIANNHWGSVRRGKKIIREHAEVVRSNNVRAAIKLQVRSVDSFIHSDFIATKFKDTDSELTDSPGTNSRYIKKTIATRLSENDFAKLVKATKDLGLISMATPFDEESVEICGRLGIDVMKIASHDAKSWTLLEKIASLKKPTVVSIGGTDIETVDKVVEYFKKKSIPLAINHCVSLYPAEDNELQLNQVSFLKNRYPNHVIGLSTHEYHDWHSSALIAYAKGARTFERHVDIDDGGMPVSKYCSLPSQVDEWFKAVKKAKEMCGKDIIAPRIISKKEEEYIKSVSRGAYALRDLPKGCVIDKSRIGKDFYLAIPLHKNQISSRDLYAKTIILKPARKDAPILFSRTKSKK